MIKISVSATCLPRVCHGGVFTCVCAGLPRVTGGTGGETGGTPGEKWYYVLVGLVLILLAVLTFTRYFIT